MKPRFSAGDVILGKPGFLDKLTIIRVEPPNYITNQVFSSEPEVAPGEVARWIDKLDENFYLSEPNRIDKVLSKYLDL
jgi:hypothetical protein